MGLLDRSPATTCGEGGSDPERCSGRGSTKRGLLLSVPVFRKNRWWGHRKPEGRAEPSCARRRDECVGEVTARFATPLFVRVGARHTHEWKSHPRHTVFRLTFASRWLVPSTPFCPRAGITAFLGASGQGHSWEGGRCCASRSDHNHRRGGRTNVWSKFGRTGLWTNLVVKVNVHEFLGVEGCSIPCVVQGRRVGCSSVELLRGCTICASHGGASRCPAPPLASTRLLALPLRGGAPREPVSAGSTGSWVRFFRLGLVAARLSSIRRLHPGGIARSSARGVSAGDA